MLVESELLCYLGGGKLFPNLSRFFGPALPLGVEAAGEFCELKLTESVSMDGLLDRLNEVSEPGIRWTGARELVEGEFNLAKSLRSVGWLAQLRDVDVESVAAAITSFCGLATLPVELVRKRQTKTVDLRECVEEI